MKDKNKEVEALLIDLSAKNVELWQENDSLRFRAPKGSLSSSDKDKMKKLKKDILLSLGSNLKEFEIMPDVENRFSDFPLTEIQEAYVIGRQDIYEYGGVSCHIYLELLTDSLSRKKVERVWNYLIKRHDMLRCVFVENRVQKVLKSVPLFSIKEENLSALPENEVKDYLDNIRRRMGHKKYNIEKWPLFDLEVSHHQDHDTMHLSIEFLIADWGSIQLLLKEFCYLYEKENFDLPDLEISFRDYVIADEKIKKVNYYKYLNDKEYWIKRISEFPQAPELPYKTRVSEEAQFSRYNFSLNANSWNRIKALAKENKVTPTVMILSLYAAVLERWSSNNRFCINLTLLTRPDIHSQINDIVGDFTSTSLLEVDWYNEITFLEMVKKIQAQLFDDIDHKLFSGIEVLRSIAANKNGEHVMMPIVFTSAIKENNEEDLNLKKFKMGAVGISQTPQVFLDCQVISDSGKLHVNWDYRNGVFDDFVIKDMFDEFCEAIINVSNKRQIILSSNVVKLPKKQLETRLLTNATSKKRPDILLHTRVFNQFDIAPNKTALIVDGDKKITYDELRNKSNDIASYLQSRGCRKGDRVGIVAEKSFEQIASVLGVVSAGCCYVPIGIDQPEMRIKKIVEQSQIKELLFSDTQFKKSPQLAYEDNSTNITSIVKSDSIERTMITSGETAYIIFTSGTTGNPKGVEITHKAAINTILDVEEKIDLNSNDTLLGVSKLNFDLSVFDIFSVLGNGGCLRLTNEEEVKNPAYIENLLFTNKITVWNSVPALMQLLIDYIEEYFSSKQYSLKKILLSGDAISTKLTNRILKIFPDIQILCLGGATEAGIWSNYFEYVCPKEFSYVPYGKPLANQQYHILDNRLRDCPNGVTGELYISGTSLGKGYIGDPNLSAEKFPYLENKKIRAYRTGDYGYYIPDGNIVFAGRKDNQIKIRGFRVELGEIEYLLQNNPNIKRAVVLSISDNKRNFLIAAVEANNKNENEVDLLKYLKLVLPEYMIPAKIFTIDEMPLSSNGKVDRNKIIEIYQKIQGSTISNSCNKELEEKIRAIWSTTLDVKTIGNDDSIYEYGADSLIMAQVANYILKMMEEDYSVNISYDTVLRNMLNNPTINDMCIFLDENLQDENKEIDGNIDLTNAEIVEFGGGTTNRLRVIIHAGLGTLNCFRYLIPNLQEQNSGLILGIAIKDSKKYCEIDKNDLITTLADDYAEQIMKYGADSIQIVGYCLGGLIAVEIARRLVERGVFVDDFTLIDSHPVRIDIHDTLFMEVNFLNNFFISICDVYTEVRSGDLEYCYKEIFKNHVDVISEQDIFNLKGNESVKRVQTFYSTVGTLAKSERFKRYVETINEKTENEMTIEMFENMYRVYVQSFKSANYTPEPYLGDVRFLLAKESVEFVSSSDDITLNFWKNVCISNVEVIPVNGNHITCIEDEKCSKEIADILMRF